MAVEISIGALTGAPGGDASVLSGTSVQARLVPVIVASNGARIDPTSGTVSAAIVPRGTGAPATFTAVTWETHASLWGASYFAQILLNGTGFVAPGPGYYDIWVQIILSGSTTTLLCPTPLLVPGVSSGGPSPAFVGLGSASLHDAADFATPSGVDNKITSALATETQRAVASEALAAPLLSMAADGSLSFARPPVYGVDSTGQPYQDPSGAASGDGAYLTFDPSDGSPVLIGLGA